MEPTQGRWVCRRCFASNEADAAACAQCGLQRGAEPGAGDEQPGAAATPPAPARPMWMQLALRFWWVGLIVVVAAAGWYFSARRDETGQISNTGDLQVNELRVGDCFDLKDPEAEEIDDVEGKRCTNPHQYELYYVAEMPDGEYPSEDAITAWIIENCVPEFAAYVGKDYQDSALDFLPVTPTEGAWDDGDHAVQCVAFDPGNAELTESLRNAAR
jgi:hypothetical protein